MRTSGKIENETSKTKEKKRRRKRSVHKAQHKEQEICVKWFKFIKFNKMNEEYNTDAQSSKKKKKRFIPCFIQWNTLPHVKKTKRK